MKARMITLRTKMRLTMLTLLGTLGMPGTPSRMFDGLSRPFAMLWHTHTHTHTHADELLPGHSERGDVPGWVLVTLMTAGLVIAIWAIAGPALINVFNTALTRILSI